MPQNRPMTPRSPIVVRAALLAVLFAPVACAAPAGTSGTSATAAAPPPAAAASPAAPDDASVAWADGVCGALTPLTTLGERFSQLDPSDRADVLTLLDATADALRQSRAGLDGVGPSPIS